MTHSRCPLHQSLTQTALYSAHPPLVPPPPPSTPLDQSTGSVDETTPAPPQLPAAPQAGPGPVSTFSIAAAPDGGGAGASTPAAVAAAPAGAAANNASAASDLLTPDKERLGLANESARIGGGAFFVYGGATLYLRRVFVVSNAAPNGAAVAVIGTNSSLLMEGGAVARNTADEAGGVLCYFPLVPRLALTAILLARCLASPLPSCGSRIGDLLIGTICCRDEQHTHSL